MCDGDSDTNTPTAGGVAAAADLGAAHTAANDEARRASAIRGGGGGRKWQQTHKTCNQERIHRGSTRAGVSEVEGLGRREGGPCQHGAWGRARQRASRRCSVLDLQSRPSRVGKETSAKAKGQKMSAKRGSRGPASGGPSLCSTSGAATNAGARAAHETCVRSYGPAALPGFAGARPRGLAGRAQAHGAAA
jgi:hypothetical protein